MKKFLGVIADDFTGACDVGVQFKKRGLETIVFTDIESLTGFESVSDIVVVNTETRNLPPEDAYKKVRRIIRLLRQNNIKLIYKKIDSTLRGNIGSEINAIMDELDFEAIVVAPAFPSQKRTVINGKLLINGIPLEKTEYANEPLSPVSNSRVSALIERQIGEKTGEIHLPKIRGDINLVVKEIQGFIKRGIRIIIADAESQSDLKRIARASIDLNILPCGSAGLASAFSLQLAIQPRMLIISGSVNSATLDQIETAVKKLNVKVIEPSLRNILEDEKKLDKASDNLMKEVEKVIADEKDVIIRLAGSKSSISEIQEMRKNRGMSKLQVANVLLSLLGEVTRRILDAYNFEGLILIGGDTSIKIMKALGAKAVRIEGETLPGIPWGRILGGTRDGMRVITKAGGFGDRYALVKIIKSMKETCSF